MRSAGANLASRLKIGSLSSDDPPSGPASRCELFQQDDRRPRVQQSSSTVSRLDKPWPVSSKVAEV
jgi:hypothetical protein